jgi:uncharacterized protein (TIGR04551 family)
MALPSRPAIEPVEREPERAEPDADSGHTSRPTFSDDWWSHARPVLEFHGYFRTRAELFYKFSLNRIETPQQAIWPRPADNRYIATNQEEFGPQLCTGAETDATSSSSTSRSQLYNCDNQTQAGANIRLRLNPEIHISDNVRILTQIDLLDNLVLGSSPEGLRYSVLDSNGLEVRARTGYNQLSFYDNSAVPPDSSSNNFSDSVRVKRAWGEYATPVGVLRFGRMPHHWGLGMLYNSGDGYDDDYQSTIDRLQFITAFPALDLSVGASWDFPNEGASGSSSLPGAQPYDLAQADDVDQYTFLLLYQKSPELQKLALSRGNLVLNSGLYFLYRNQTFANDQALPASEGGTVPGANPDRLANAFARRDGEAYVPDVWLQLLYKKFRFEAELASILGSIGSASIEPNTEDTFQSGQKLKIRQWGLATQLEQKLVEDRLRLGFGFGWGTGDPDAYDPSQPGNLIPGPNEQQINDNTISTFRFNPSYHVDLILNRNILQRVQGSYYFRPSVEYDFVRNQSGQRAGGGVQAIWTRASEFVQTPGHDADLGLELNGTLYFQAKDGALNDTPDTMGGFYSALQYGVLFPLAGMGYQTAEKRTLPGNNDTGAAQILRLYLGILF